jgi:hypothetical protein
LFFLDPSPFVTRAAKELRRVVSVRYDIEALLVYRIIWTLEFRTTDSAGHADLRTQVAEDLRRIRSLPEGTDPALAETLLAGARLIKDTEEIRRAEKIVASQRPTRDQYREGIDAWRKRNPSPAESAPEEQKRAWRRAYLAEIDVWRSRFPEEVMVWLDRFFALVKDGDKQQFLEAADRLRALEKKGHYRGLPIDLFIASGYVRSGIRLEEVIRTVQDFLARWASGERRNPGSDLLHPEEEAMTAREHHFHNEISAVMYLAEASFLLGKSEIAYEPLRRMEAEINWWKTTIEEWKKSQKPGRKGASLTSRDVLHAAGTHAARF